MIDPLSLIPLHLETYYDNYENGKTHVQNKIADATGFVYYKHPEYYLITNWHVVSGRNPQTGKPSSKHAGIPNIIKIWFPVVDSHSWYLSTQALCDYKTDEKSWIEHPRGREVDVAALPLNSLFKYYPLDPIFFDTQLKISPSEPVSVIGYPFGLSSDGSYPIWKTAYVASEIENDYDGKPVFLIDGTIRPGMSGSPVIARRKGYVNDDKSNFITISEADKFLGVFSGGISNKYDTEIGMVWKPEVIDEILDNKDELIKNVKQFETVRLY